MNTKKTAFLLFGLLVFAWACEKTETPLPVPSADFSFVQADSAARRVVFTNLSKNAENYFWDFGDGTQASVENPKHIYEQAGTYTVRLLASGSGGSDKAAKTVTLAEPPLALFEFSGGNCTAPCKVIFENRSVNANKWLWDFGDGSSSEKKAPEHLYEAGGNYTVRLTSSGPGGISKTSRTVAVQDSLNAPIASFEIQNGGCGYPCPVTFLNTSKFAQKYLWDFGNGSTSAQVSPKYTYTAAGIYTVKLQATGANGTDTETRTVEIK